MRDVPLCLSWWAAKQTFSLSIIKFFCECLFLFFHLQLEDSITRHKARVTSTLDRLAHKVALDKKERANKCKAFKVNKKFIYKMFIFVGSDWLVLLIIGRCLKARWLVFFFVLGKTNLTKSSWAAGAGGEFYKWTDSWSKALCGHVVEDAR